jgi:YidC/Oxa1 family membrane protein insertase
MEQRRVLLAVGLCTVFFLVYMWAAPRVFPPPPRPAATASAGTDATARGSASGGDAAAARPGDRGGESTHEAGETVAATPTETGFGETLDLLRGSPTVGAIRDRLDSILARRAEAERVVLENDAMRLEFTLPEAVLDRVLLRRYVVEAGLDEVERRDPTRWVPVVEPGWIGPRVLTIRDATSGSTALEDLRWAVTDHEPSRRIRFEAPIEGGDRLGVEVRLPPAEAPPHHVEVEIGIVGDGTSIRRVLVTFAAAGFEERGPFSTGATVLLRRSDGRKETNLVHTLPEFAKGFGSVTDVEEGQNRNVWAALVTRYFAAAVRPLEPEATGGEGASIRQMPPSLGPIVVEPLDDPLALRRALAAFDPTRPLTDDERATVAAASRTNLAISSEVRLEPSGTPAARTRRFLLYLGPKDPAVLAQPSYAPFREIVAHDYGSFLQPIVSALVLLLRFFHWATHNYGIAIILLTILVRAILFPVTLKQQRSMAKFQEASQRLKPKIEALQERYKNNPKKLREEQMRLMQAEGATFPLAGCLTMLLQMPVFFGLFQTLRVAFELRQQPFVLWITDLSRPDAVLDLPFAIPLTGSSTLNVLPIAMTVCWFLQQKMTPLPPDPQAAQSQKILQFMPILFGFMLYNYAAGLSLYMLVNSLLGIAEMKFLRPRFGKPTTPAPAGNPPPAPRSAPVVARSR